MPSCCGRTLSVLLEALSQCLLVVGARSQCFATIEALSQCHVVAGALSQCFRFWHSLSAGTLSQCPLTVRHSISAQDALTAPLLLVALSQSHTAANPENPVLSSPKWSQVFSQSRGRSSQGFRELGVTLGLKGFVGVGVSGFRRPGRGIVFPK